MAKKSWPSSVVDRVLDLSGLDAGSYRWGE